MDNTDILKFSSESSVILSKMRTEERLQHLEKGRHSLHPSRCAHLQTLNGSNLSYNVHKVLSKSTETATDSFCGVKGKKGKEGEGGEGSWPGEEEQEEEGSPWQGWKAKIHLNSPFGQLKKDL